MTGRVYEIFTEVPIISDTCKSVGGAGADKTDIALESAEIPGLLSKFVANAVMVYVILFARFFRVTELELVVESA